MRQIQFTAEVCAYSAGGKARIAVNHLAHFLLAENHAASRTGNFLGDFVTGRPETLLERLPRPIVAGIVRHRAIDAFTDYHPVTARLRTAISPERRRFAGAIVDVFHDHFLTLRWPEFSDQPLDGFAEACNGALLQHFDHLPPHLANSLGERMEARWLENYGSEEGLADVFTRMAARRPGFGPMAGAMDDFVKSRDIFAEGFALFFPELLRFVRDLGPEDSHL